MTVDGNDHDDEVTISQVLKDMEGGIEVGFQLATFRGPLCGEPLQGVGIFIDELRLNLHYPGGKLFTPSDP